MSNNFIAFKELVIAHDEIKLLHSFKIRQLQGTASIHVLGALDCDKWQALPQPQSETVMLFPKPKCSV